MVLFEILLIASQNWHVRIFITTPFSVYPAEIPAGQGRCNNICNSGVAILIVILLLQSFLALVPISLVPIPLLVPMVQVSELEGCSRRN